VLSRCQRHEFRRVPVSDIVANLSWIAEHEKLEVEPEVLTLVARQATGSLRDAVSLLDQLAATSEAISLEAAQAVLGTATNQSVLEIVDAVLGEDSAGGLDAVHRALDSGSDPRQFGRQIVDYLRNLLLVRMGNAAQVDATSEIRAQMARHAQAFEVQALLRAIRIFNQAATESHNTWHPALPLEMALIEAMQSPAETVAPVQVAEKAEKIESTPQRTARLPKPAASQPKAQEVTQTAEPQPEPAAEPLPVNVGQHWREILSVVRQANPQTQALLNSCKPLGVKNGALILGFNGEFAKSKMEQGENIEIFCQAMQQVLGEAMPVRCVMTVGGALPDDIDQDGMVAAALRDLGGEIVDIQ
jgi:DNA polymerase-3 subunit gamma/tau